MGHIEWGLRTGLRFSNMEITGNPGKSCFREVRERKDWFEWVQVQVGEKDWGTTSLKKTFKDFAINGELRNPAKREVRSRGRLNSHILLC